MCVKKCVLSCVIDVFPFCVPFLCNLPVSEVFFAQTCHKQGSHNRGKSGEVMEKFVVMESHGKVMENNKNIKSHGKVKILP